MIEEPQPVLRCDHFARRQREPRGAHGDLQAGENVGQRARNDHVEQDILAVRAEAGCRPEVILVDGFHAHHGVERSGEESHEEGDEDHGRLGTGKNQDRERHPGERRYRPQQAEQR